jgi:hypothetical protein
MSEVPCPDCGVSGESPDSGSGQWRCGACGRGYYLRRCAACGEVSFVGVPHGWHHPWDCTWCTARNEGFTQFRDPAAATVTELATSVARRELSFTLAKDVAANTTGLNTGPLPFEPPAPRPHRGPPPGEDRTRPRTRRILLLSIGALAVLAVTAVLIGMRPGTGVSSTASASSADSAAAGRSGSGVRARQVSVSMGQAGTVIFQGVPGTVTIVGEDTARVSLTGQLHWTGHEPTAVTRLDRGSHTLLLSYRCAPASPCGESFRLAVPSGAAVMLRQSSARLTISGLAGLVDIVGAHIQATATRLRATTLTATVVSGTLSASFEVAPSLVSVTLTSAQGTLRLPGDTPYRVSQQVVAGSVKVAVPQARDAPSSVAARVTSGDLELLSS